MRKLRVGYATLADLEYAEAIATATASDFARRDGDEVYEVRYRYPYAGGVEGVKRLTVSADTSRESIRRIADAVTGAGAEVTTITEVAA